jgi:hypothetical protein
MAEGAFLWPVSPLLEAAKNSRLPIGKSQKSNVSFLTAEIFEQVSHQLACALTWIKP